MRRSAIGQFFSCPHEQPQKALRELTSFFLVSKVANFICIGSEDLSANETAWYEEQNVRK